MKSKKYRWIGSIFIYLVTAYAMSFIGNADRGSNDYVFGLVAALGVFFIPWIAQVMNKRKQNKETIT